jgi:hypothetical protein
VRGDSLKLCATTPGEDIRPAARNTPNALIGLERV